MTALLEVEDLSVSFALRRGFFQRERRLRAVDGVSFELAAGEILGLVGESGSGKSTTGRALLRLVEPDRGTVRLRETELTALSGQELRRHRRRIQMVFQDPYSSLDPSMVIAESVGEPLEVHEGLRGKERDDRVRDLLVRVGLSARHLERYPYEFSGGQRQRLAIARALAVDPDVVICDEAVSALDVSTQNQIINLLEELRAELGTSYLFISHDLAVVRQLAQRVAVMYLGRLVEDGPAQRIYPHPAHPYTEALLSAVPVPNPKVQRQRERIVLPGDPPDPTNPPDGCAFHPRCPYAMDICRVEVPQPTPVDGGGTVRCHLHTSGPTLAGGSVIDLRPAAGPVRPRTSESGGS
ncbi:ATP-binding cassette domain-containing protein [Saccharopolyspora sp. K220]|uniref:ABC transporter ATP-binding protein n=1 Tax=Saccharopolyspora soli TaxID=2926618 RepID=UPI001F56843A|nr:oligopeptide/dipeptide ABC transporter ATP-binding protein [Saccharopolyspora soli]MCI2416404.1 ATP-binding cassette domain-containing protein [Saccharopolyspora soli]